jgi:hypothetical protein
MEIKDNSFIASPGDQHSNSRSHNENTLNIRAAGLPPADSISAGKLLDELDEAEQQIAAAGEEKFNRLGWKQLTLMLVVEAIALGALSIPSAFATLGMIAGVICCIGIGLIAVYTSYVIGQVKLAFPFIHHYGDAGTLMMGRFGYELFSAMFLLQLIFVTGSHCLTGTIALQTITGSTICSLVFGLIRLSFFSSLQSPHLLLM